MTTRREHPRRRRLLGRRPPPAVHRPVPPAPETPAEVLERAADDVSRETSVGPYVAGGQVPDPLTGRGLPVDPPSPEEALAEQAALDWPVAPPPLRKDQVARLEALTAVWERQVRLEGPADATLLYSAPRLPPVPPSRPAPGPALAPADREPVPGQRVSDWASRHDPRSLEYAVRRRLAGRVPVVDVLLEHGPILDQGTTPPLTLAEASACVGMASVAAANVLELAGPAVPATPPLLAGVHGLLGAEDARELYHRAQELDGVDVAAGTSVLAGMKAGREAGWWDTYLWALGGTQDVAQVLLQLRVAVVIGIPWDSSLEEPNAAGIITPGGTPAGGHSLAVVGLQRIVAGQAGPFFVLQQSRGTSEGVGGLVYVHHRHLAQLLGGVGEAAVPLPRSAG